MNRERLPPQVQPAVDFKNAAAALRKAISEAWSTASDWSAALTISTSDPEFYERRLLHQIYGLYVSVSFLLESLGLSALLSEFKVDYAKVRPGNTIDVELDEFGNPYPAALDFIQTYAAPLVSSIVPSESFNELPLLERVLQGVPRLLKDRGIEPSNEAEVRRVLYETLIHVFPDTVRRDIPIAKVSKTYKPDIGVRALQTAIEFKFCDTEAELKTAIGGVFEDISGYEGSNDWVNFYAVFYMTDAFMTPAQLEAEFRLARVDLKWRPMLLTGKGGRKRFQKTVTANAATRRARKRAPK